MSDACWQAAGWNSLNYVWMPWEGTVDSADYYGRFKVVWSSETQLLYVLVEVTDDMLVERYQEMGNTAYYNDIVEVFIDEDASGGIHIFDGSSADLGYNAENAFSYHVTPLGSPDNEGTVNTITVINLDGTNWGDSHEMNYVDHFPEFALHKDDNHYVWEFSMIVYTDLYEMDAAEGTEAILEEGKILGLALAYCETDSPDVYQRQMFMGSYPGIGTILSSADNGNLYGYNDAWRNADDYNVCVLASPVETSVTSPYSGFNDLQVYFIPETGGIGIQFGSPDLTDVDISVYSLDGRIIQNMLFPKHAEHFTTRMNMTAPPGIYLVSVRQDLHARVRKLIIF